MEEPNAPSARYHRQMLLPGIGRAGQEAMRDAHALIVGVGATGAGLADLLARAGVGRLTLIDRDLVESTNLQRQTLYTESDVGSPKAVAAGARVAGINAEIQSEPLVMDLTARTVDRLPLGTNARTVLLDGTDNFETRFLLNDLAVREGLPFVYAGVVGTGGMTMTVRPGATACLRCLFDGPPPPGSQPTCDTAGVLGPAVAAIAGLAAASAIRLLVGDPAPPVLRQIDAWSGASRETDLGGARNPACPCCVERRFEHLEDRGGDSATLCGQRAVQVSPRAGRPAPQARVDLSGLGERLGAHGAFLVTPFLVRGRLDNETADDGHAEPSIGLTVFADGRAIVDGTDRPERARKIYAAYVGS